MKNVLIFFIHIFLLNSFFINIAYAITLPSDPTEWADTDGDGVGDNSDNCAAYSNTAQVDLDANGIGDMCESVGTLTGSFVGYEFRDEAWSTGGDFVSSAFNLTFDGSAIGAGEMWHATNGLDPDPTWSFAYSILPDNTLIADNGGDIGTISYNQNYMVFSDTDVAGDDLMMMPLVRKGSGMTNASINGTYYVAQIADENGLGVPNITFTLMDWTFDGAGGMTVNYLGGGTPENGTYSVADDGAWIDSWGKGYFSSDRSVFAYVETAGPDFIDMMVGVKRGTNMTTADLYGDYVIHQIGYVATLSRSFSDRTNVTFDGLGGYTAADQATSEGPLESGFGSYSVTADGTIYIDGVASGVMAGDGQSVVFANVDPAVDPYTGINFGVKTSLSDRDGDTVSDSDDNCPVDANPNQYDYDGDGTGDMCSASQPGTYFDGTRWVECAAGYYQDQAGQNSCIPAPVGTYVASVAAATYSSCVPGTYQNQTAQTSCVDAPAGTFVSGTMAIVATDCPGGTYQDQTGQTSCLLSPAGTYSGSGQAAPSDCALGTYQPSTGQSSCIDAPAGSYVGTTGAASVTLCPAGTYQDQVGQSVCVAAPAGTYVDAAGASTYFLCPIQTYQDLTGQTTCTSCTPGTSQTSTGQAICFADADDDNIEDSLDNCPNDPDNDLDGDLVCGDVDAFPNDVAASVDTDGDGYPDSWNTGYGQANSTTPLYLDLFPLDPTEWADADSDGYGDNGDVYPLDPTEWADDDADHLPDNFETNNFGNLTSEIASGDPDGDGWTNLAEFIAGTDPTIDNTGLTDTDGDGLPDAYETANGLDLNDPSDVLADADGDGYSNYHEYLLGLDPQSDDSGLADSDGDGMPDEIEWTLGTNPTVADATEDPDGDFLTNLEEMYLGTLPLVDNATMTDTDGDGIPDQAEILAGTDPNFDDADLDLDGDGIANIDEYHNGTLAIDNADLADTDGDGLPDMWEQANGLPVGTDNSGTDSDGDNVSDVDEYLAGINPLSQDTDGDGINDDVDLFPLDPTPIPDGLSHAPDDRGNKGVKRQDGEPDNDNKVNGNPKRDVPFVFHVVVHEGTGNAPDRVLVHINGYENELIKIKGDVATGAIYELEKLLGPAHGHKYHFTAEDISGNILWTLPLAGEYTGPTVELLNGVSMVGVSCDVRSANLDAMAGLGSSSCNRWISADLARDSSSGAYVAVDASGPVATGEGYFMTREASPTLPDLSSQPQVGETTYEIALNPGWNIISVPYNGYVALADIQVQKRNDAPVTWTTATTSKWLTNAIYTYDGADWGGTYSFDFAPSAELVPWVGYWVYLNLDNTNYKLIVPKPAQ
ncbi:MAG: hypothetical protein K0A93_11925 [Desulfuromonadaceae bacterium]|nr:hypothetical protein [Desulfuromonadaceae bacterium]